MARVLNLVVFFALIAAPVAVAETPQPSGVTNQWFEPCSFWRYDFNASAYVCSALGPQMSVPSNMDVDMLRQTVSDLQRQIQQLEYRVQRLENQ